LVVDDQQGRTSYQMLTQTDVVRFLFNHARSVGAFSDVSLEELGLANPQGMSGGGLVCVHSDCTALQAFRLMMERGLICVPVVDRGRGDLVGVFSCSDIKGISAETLHRMNLPVLQFIEAMTGQKPAVPIAYNSKSQLSQIIPHMLAAKVHRVFLVDSALVPTGVVTMTDIISCAFGLPSKPRPAQSYLFQQESSA